MREKWICLGKVGFSNRFKHTGRGLARYLIYLYWNYSPEKKVRFKAQLIDRKEKREGWVDLTNELDKTLQSELDDANKRPHIYMHQKEFLKWNGEKFILACLPILQQVLMRWTFD